MAAICLSLIVVFLLSPSFALGLKPKCRWEGERGQRLLEFDSIGMTLAAGEDVMLCKESCERNSWCFSFDYVISAGTRSCEFRTYAETNGYSLKADPTSSHFVKICEDVSKACESNPGFKLYQSADHPSMCLRSYTPAQGKTFAEAESECGKQGSWLVVAKTQATLDFLFDQLPDDVMSTGPWVGANDRAEEGKFLWSDGSALARGSNLWWSGRSPQHLSQFEARDCVEAKKGPGVAPHSLSDSGCANSVKPFICERLPSGEEDRFMTDMSTTFDCNRPTTPCVGESVCWQGQCNCTGDNRGPACGTEIATADLNARQCHEEAKCLHGACHFSTLYGVRCLCHPGFYGDQCEIPMLEVVCSDDRMWMYLLPWGYDMDTWGNTNPRVKSATDASKYGTLSPVMEMTYVEGSGFELAGRDGFAGVFMHVGDAKAGDAKYETINATLGVYSREIDVFYKPTANDPTDQKLTVGCTVERIFDPTENLNWGEGDFSCERPTTPCDAGGTCDVFTEKCTCKPGFTGLQCTLPKEDLFHGVCTAIGACKSDQQGVCYNTGQGVGCLCKDGFYGSRCEHPMVSAECSEENMVVNVRPYGFGSDLWKPEFTVTTQAKSGPECKLKLSQDFVAANLGYRRRNWDGFTDTFKHTGDPCAMNIVGNKLDESTISYERVVKVSYSVNPHHTNQVLRVQCNVTIVPETTTTATTTTPKASTGQVTTPRPGGSSSNTTRRPPLTTKPTHMQGLPPPRVDLTWMDELGRPVRGWVRPGTVLYVVISVDPRNNRNITDLMVRSCYVKDSYSRQYNLAVTNSCARDPVGLDVIATGVGRRVLVLRAWRASPASALALQCRVQLCPWGDARCGWIHKCTKRFRYRRSLQPQLISKESLVVNVVQSVGG